MSWLVGDATTPPDTPGATERWAAKRLPTPPRTAGGVGARTVYECSTLVVEVGREWLDARFPGGECVASWASARRLKKSGPSRCGLVPVQSRLDNAALAARDELSSHVRFSGAAELWAAAKKAVADACAGRSEPAMASRNAAAVLAALAAVRAAEEHRESQPSDDWQRIDRPVILADDGERCLSAICRWPRGSCRSWCATAPRDAGTISRCPSCSAPIGRPRGVPRSGGLDFASRPKSIGRRWRRRRGIRTEGLAMVDFAFFLFGAACCWGIFQMGVHGSANGSRSRPRGH